MEYKIQKEIAGNFNKLTKLESYFKNDSLCLVKDNESLDFFRASITNIKTNSIEVLLIDYGTYLQTTEENLYKLPVNLWRYSCLSIPVYLTGLILPEVGQDVGDACIEQMHQLLTDN